MSDKTKNTIATDDENFLEVRDLVVEYTSEGSVVHAVNGVSFSVKKGHTLALVGETGAGKTSIAKSIIRVLPPNSSKIPRGEIMLGGRDLLKLEEVEMRKVRGRDISMVFQDPMTALNPSMRIGDQISEVVKAHNNISKSEATEQAMSMLEMVGIPRERFREYPHQFSGGMKQRVVIAIALACNPALLLADEPTTALDVTIQAQVLEMINNLKEKFDTAMILITHDLGVVAETSDDVAVVYAGEIIEMGDIVEVFDHPKHPYTIGLFGALPNMNTNAKRLHAIDGLPPDPTDLPAGCKFSPRCPYAMDICRGGEIPEVEVAAGHRCRCHKVAMEMKSEA